MLRWAFRLTGVGFFFVGLSSYFGGIPWPFNCESTVCIIGTKIISLKMALLGIGTFLIFISYLMTKRRK